MGMSIAEFRDLQKAVRPLKYRNQPFVVGSERYRSMKEFRFHVMCKALTHVCDLHQRIVQIEREVYFQLVPAQRAMGYFLDFRLTYADGRIDHIDTKSPVTRKIPGYIHKRKLMLERHGIHIMEV